MNTGAEFSIVYAFSSGVSDRISRSIDLLTERFWKHSTYRWPHHEPDGCASHAVYPTFFRGYVLPHDMSPSESPDKYTPANDEPLSTAIITALSNAKGRDITKDECVLYDSIDLDSLDGMFREESEGDSIKVEFTTHDAIVIVWGDGRKTIEVQDLEADPNHR